MRRPVVIALLLATASGGLAAIQLSNWMRDVANRPRHETVQAPSIDLTTVVVAKEDVAFGTTLSKELLTEVEWPATAVPKGSFKLIKDMFAEDPRRTALIAIGKGEPVLSNKVTGPGQRASLSAMLGDGKKAVSIRVNDVIGVGGFVLPGDRVDVVLTRTVKDSKAGAAQTVYNDVLLQNVRVLAVDQTADPKFSSPKIVRTVTVETSLEEAQKIILGSTVGELSLVLRDNGTGETVTAAQRISADDLGDNGEKRNQATAISTIAVAADSGAVSSQPVDAKRTAKVKVSVFRAAASTEYSVAHRTE